MCERPLIGSTSACACVQTGRGGGAVARTSLPAPLHHRSERLERLVPATVLPPSTLCSTIRYTVCVHYPITENSNCTLLLRYCTVCTRYSYPWVRGALSTESRISVKRRSIQDFPGLGPLCVAPPCVFRARAPAVHDCTCCMALLARRSFALRRWRIVRGDGVRRNSVVVIILSDHTIVLKHWFQLGENELQYVWIVCYFSNRLES